MTSAWLAFWNGSHSIYVNARHRDVHYRLIAEAIVPLVPRREARVLDYGCGELHADRVAAVAGEVLLCEAAPRVRARFAKNAKIRAVAPDDRWISSCCTRSRNTSSPNVLNFAPESS
jgi:hypothetical protein